MRYTCHMIPADTTADAYRVQIGRYRRLEPAARVQIALEMSEETREVTRQGIRHRHPEYDEAEVEAALRRLILGDELYRAAWPTGIFLDP